MALPKRILMSPIKSLFTSRPRGARTFAAGLFAAGAFIGANGLPAARASDAGRDFAPFISAGATHVALLKSDGNVVSWGTDAHGELGDGTTKTKGVLPECAGGCNQNVNWTQVAAGTSFTLARRTDGTIWAWGSSNVNRNGAGSSADLTSPGEVGEFNNFWRSVAAGASHGFAISVDGELYGWGDNAQGELGINSTSTPGYLEQQTGTSSDHWIAVAPGTQFTIGLKADGSAWGFGLNSSGQLGIGNTTRALVPTAIVSTKPWTRLTAGTAHAAGIKADGTLWLWGLNDKGQLGNNSTTTGKAPAQLSVAGPWVAVSAGGHHTMAIKSDGSLWAWGSNSNGQLGIGSTTDKLVPTRVGTLNTWQYVTAGLDFTVAVQADGSVYTFGHAASGQLGNNTTTDANAPGSPVAVGVKTPMMVGGAQHGGAIRSSGVLETNGYDGDGELGIGTADSTVFKYSQPQTVASTLPWTYMAAGGTHTLGVKSNGTLWAWGGNTVGEVGSGNTTRHSSPVQIGTDTKWTKVFAALGSSSFGIKADGTLWAWGYNGTGNLGDGTLTNRNAPTPIGASLNEYWVAVAPGYDHTLGLTADGKLWAWGNNANGQLGDNSAESQISSPKQIGTLNDWLAIAAGFEDSTGILGDGSLLAWGYNQDDEVGDGTQTTRTGPTTIGYGAIQTCRTYYSSLAMAVDGTLLGWGFNAWGELGDSSFSSVSTPTANPNQDSLQNLHTVACGGLSSYLTDTTGGEYGSGDNSYGQLGIQANGPDERTYPEGLDRFYYPEDIEPLSITPTASSSQTGHDPTLTGSVDGSYWTTGVAQASGQWFKLAFDSATSFSQILLTAGTSTTYPRSYQVFVSNDNTNWGSAIATGVGTQQAVPIAFPQQKAKYVKIVLNGSSTSLWTIDDLEVMY
jgi:alpha-tubulin suppressor-like RCC1 family protein